MNKRIKNGLLGVALLATIVLNASDLKEFKVSESEVSEVKNLDISFSEVLVGETLIITNDKNGNVVYNETLVMSGVYTLSIDFTKFTQGVYNLTSVVGDVTKITPFIVSPKTSTVIKGETKIYIAPKITKNDDFIDISINNEGLNPVSIIIYEGSHELAITKNNTNAEIHKKYNLINLSSGVYSVVVKVGEKIYEKEIKLYSY